MATADLKFESVRVDVQNLAKGMYVCKLDRPWLATPFPFQGFVIRSMREIEMLRNYCAYVYIDVLRGVSPDQKLFGKADPLAAARRSDIRVARLPVRREQYKKSRSLRREMRRAGGLHHEVLAEVTDVLSKLNAGDDAVSMTAARKSITKMVRSVICNPDAMVWMMRLRQHDDYTHGHAVRSAIYALLLGRHLGLDEDELNDLAMASLFADIGKVRIDREVLEKRGQLTAHEERLLKRHVEMGVKILQDMEGANARVIEAVATHHERFDGSGYPNALKGDRIPLMGRIVGLADAFDAMTSRRPYSDDQMTIAEALAFLYDHRDILFQTQLIEEFIRAVGIYPTGSLIELSTGEIAMVVEQNADTRLHPRVVLLINPNGHRYPSLREFDLAKLKGAGDSGIDIRRAVVAADYDVNVAAVMRDREASRPFYKRISIAA